MYKMQVPFIVVFNKTDVISHQFAVDWMRDGESFQDAVRDEESYSGTLVASMSLMLEEFYSTLRVCLFLSGFIFHCLTN